MKKKLNSNIEYECPLCGEYLVLNREGTMTNKITGDFLYVYLCEECNQAFVLNDNEEIKILPYDSKMNRIENKCKVCNKIEHFNEMGLFLLNIDTTYYEFHCFECAIPILQEWINKNTKEKVKVTQKNIHNIYEIYDFNKSNEMLQEMQKYPEKYEKIMNKVNEEINNLKKDAQQSI